MKIKCYFPDDLEKDQDPLEITRVHGINPIQSTEYTLCSIAWEEWDCEYSYHDRITDESITCEKCIEVLNNINKTFKKTKNGWE